ncbi:hypothetical protein QTN47_25750 [Danxiaibacter flavus]|uniref:Uncharacterized protein n=1 Tax=Danxiaibacter flavus TaxID=3049108 RepID=A0ABV3ZN41_9BACT|nr:hypothetical protein QNM32_25750 [Chitinophagaceae bacterium DXS]
MKIAAILLALSFAITARSQNTINSYRYVLVPQKFDFLRSDDQYGVNTYTKLLLQGVGFNAFLTNEVLPPEVAANKCNALKAEIVEKKKFLTTVLTLLLKDCQGNVIFKSGEGKSSAKEWAVAYSEALQNAFASLKAAQYKYDSTKAIQPMETAASAVPPASVAATASPVPSAGVVAGTAAVTVESNNVLYAQLSPNGYQLVDTTPKKVMTLLKTSQQDIFIADDGVLKGIVFRKNNEWFFEYYKNDKLESLKLNIKF